MNVIEINRKRSFTLEEAQSVVKVVFRITEIYSYQVHALVDRLEKLESEDQALSLELKAEVDLLIRQWQNKVQKLGAHPKGLWIADFDSGNGYFCWKYPEPQIEFWHSYQDGFSKRTPVSLRFIPELIQTNLDSVQKDAEL